MLASASRLGNPEPHHAADAMTPEPALSTLDIYYLSPMATHQRREAALKLLAATGMRRSNYEPPILRLLWRLGFINVPPPHFAPFWACALLSGVYFCFIWGVLMWFLTWSRQGMSGSGALAASAFAGFLFGLSMAGYYAYSRRKHGLPPWQELH